MEQRTSGALYLCSDFLACRHCVILNDDNSMKSLHFEMSCYTAIKDYQECLPMLGSWFLNENRKARKAPSIQDRGDAEGLS
jgi:hypothetical protein